MTDSSRLYKQHYVDKDFDRLELFVLLRERYSINRILYPGSFVHITPSFVFPLAVYADTDRRTKHFFADPWTGEFIEKNKRYDEKAIVRFHPQDYTNDLPEEPESFDLLVSQWAGFVSQACKRYLRKGGLLLVNNSHGDASLASIDNDYRFIAAVMRRNGKYRLVENDLEHFFVPKSDVEVTREYLLKIQRGIGYTRPAWAYLFELGIDFSKRRL
jgi:SAM-dependent methyltransferase